MRRGGRAAAGDVAIGDLEVAAGHMQVANGDIEVTIGNMQVTNGNIEVTIGHIEVASGHIPPRGPPSPWTVIIISVRSTGEVPNCETP